MAVGEMDKPTGPTGILSSDRKPPSTKGDRHVAPKSRKGLVCAPKPVMGKRR